MIARRLVFLFSLLAACTSPVREEPHLGDAESGCVPNTTACMAGAVVRCAPDGSDFELLFRCEPGEVCDEGACVPGPEPAPVGGDYDRAAASDDGLPPPRDASHAPGDPGADAARPTADGTPPDVARGQDTGVPPVDAAPFAQDAAPNLVDAAPPSPNDARLTPADAAPDAAPGPDAIPEAPDAAAPPPDAAPPPPDAAPPPRDAAPEPPAACGDGLLSPDELCDPALVAAISCSTIPGARNPLAWAFCTPECTVDTTACALDAAVEVSVIECEDENTDPWTGTGDEEVVLTRCDDDVAYRDTHRAPGECLSLRVTVHVYADARGPAMATGALAPYLEAAATYFAQGNVHLVFTNAAAPDVIQSADVDLSTRRFSLATRRNNDPDAMDVYIVRDLYIPRHNNGRDTLCGKAGRAGPGVRDATRDGVVVSTGLRCGDPETLAHELAHQLGLSHTFQDFDAAEDPADCAAVGDYCCDTAPDCGRLTNGIGCPMPAAPACVLAGCQGCDADPATPFVPDADTPRQIMSYFGPCRDHFTPDQHARIRCFAHEEFAHALVDCEAPPAPCDGPETEACGQCGTRRRRCDAGVWSAWSVCEGEGPCLAGAVEACPADGARVCDATCQWGPCGECEGHGEGDVLSASPLGPELVDGPCDPEAERHRTLHVCRGGVATDEDDVIRVARDVEGHVLQSEQSDVCESVDGRPCTELGLRTVTATVCRGGEAVTEEQDPASCVRETNGDLVETGLDSACEPVDERCDDGVIRRTDLRCAQGEPAPVEEVEPCRLGSADEIAYGLWGPCQSPDFCALQGARTRSVTVCGPDGRLVQSADAEACPLPGHEGAFVVQGPWSAPDWESECDEDAQRTRHEEVCLGGAQVSRTGTTPEHRAREGVILSDSGPQACVWDTACQETATSWRDYTVCQGGLAVARREAAGQCNRDTDAYIRSYGDWGQCGGYATVCAESATRTRTVFGCTGAQESTRQETGTCGERDTDGVETWRGAPGACNWSDTCDESARMLTPIRTCRDGREVASTLDQPCVRDTDGGACGCGTCGGAICARRQGSVDGCTGANFDANCVLGGCQACREENGFAVVNVSACNGRGCTNRIPGGGVNGFTWFYTVAPGTALSAFARWGFPFPLTDTCGRYRISMDVPSVAGLPEPACGVWSVTTAAQFNLKSGNNTVASSVVNLRNNLGRRVTLFEGNLGNADAVTVGNVTADGGRCVELLLDRIVIEPIP